MPPIGAPTPPRILVVETKALLAHFLVVGCLIYVYGGRLRPQHARYGLN